MTRHLRDVFPVRPAALLPLGAAGGQAARGPGA
jgi:hypothetical protein